MRPALRRPEPSTLVSTSSSDSRLTTHSDGWCRVPGCPNPDCKLSTHLKYDPKVHVFPNRQSRRKYTNTAGNLQLAYRTPQIVIQSNGVDGLPALPGNKQDPELISLFHHFFTSVFEPLAQVFRGPSVASMSEYKDRMLGTALKSEAYCMGLILQSQTDLDICRRQTSELRTSLEIYTKTMAAFRNQIEMVEKFPHSMQIELALLTLCTLTSYDIFHRRDAAIKTHWIGLQHLVTRRGGLHCVTLSLAYVVHVDRSCAQQLNVRPAFSTPSLQVVPLWKPQVSSNGFAFRDRDGPVKGTFMSHVVNHCMNSCDLLDLWEVVYGQSAHTSQTAPLQSTPSPEYMYYLRDKVDEEFSTLHAELWDREVRDRCLVWATRIIEYPVTWANQVPTMNIHICEHLLRVLRAEDLSKVWEGNTDMLVWILFALATLQTFFDGRDQVIVYLRAVLSLKHGDLQRSEVWWPAELENVRKFVWSNSHNTPHFYDVCRELQNNSAATNAPPNLAPIAIPSSSTPPDNN